MDPIGKLIKEKDKDDKSNHKNILTNMNKTTQDKYNV